MNGSGCCCSHPTSNRLGSEEVMFHGLHAQRKMNSIVNRLRQILQYKLSTLVRKCALERLQIMPSATSHIDYEHRLFVLHSVAQKTVNRIVLEPGNPVGTMPLIESIEGTQPLWPLIQKLGHARVDLERKLKRAMNTVQRSSILCLLQKGGHRGE